MGVRLKLGDASTRPRIALTRAIEDSTRSAERLRRLGYAGVVAPATRIVATRIEAPDGDWDAVVATSAKAFDQMSAGLREAIVELPLFVVGARTAQAAAELGLGLAEAPSIDASALAERLRACLAPMSRVLYLAGRDRKSDLERALTAAGHRPTACEIYAAEARVAWSSREVRAVATCDAALHYSTRGAELALRLAEGAGIGDRFRALLHVCISEDAAASLRAASVARVCSAEWPEEDALLATLARALRSAEQ